MSSLEETIAAALESFDYIDVSDAHADAEEYEQITGRVAAAVREWCLAEPQIERVARQLMWDEDPYAKITGWAGLHAESHADYIERARAAVRAVMGDEQ